MKRLLVAMLLALVAVACGPIYSTEYNYRPPADDQGRACIAQCNAGKTTCRSNADLKAENERLRCEQDASSEYRRCQNRAVNDAARAECVERSCNFEADTGICEGDYRICFQSCGGVVESRQVCTFNCP